MKMVLWRPFHDRKLSPALRTTDWSHEERRAVTYYRTTVASTISGVFGSRFWTDVLPRMAEKEAAVFHAVVALASISESSSENSIYEAKTEAGPVALRHYSQAIKQLQQDLKKPEPRTEVVLMANILLICFEMSQNHFESALRQISSGVFLYLDWCAKQRRTSRRSRPSLSEVEQYLGRVYHHLMLHHTLYIDTHLSNYAVYMPELVTEMREIPATFESIDEAKECLDSCMSQQVHKAITDRMYDNFRGELDKFVRDSISRPIFQIRRAPLDAWYRAFRIFRRTRVDPTFKEQQAMTFLEIQVLAWRILSSVSVPALETAFDAFLHEFAQIVALAQEVAPALEAQQWTVQDFDIGLVPPLYFVAGRCRDPCTRRQAISLLRTLNRREGPWDSTMLWRIVEKIADTEEGCKTVTQASDVPACDRVVLLETNIHSAIRTVEVDLGRLGALGEREVLKVWVQY